MLARSRGCSKEERAQQAAAIASHKSSSCCRIWYRPQDSMDSACGVAEASMWDVCRHRRCRLAGSPLSSPLPCAAWLPPFSDASCCWVVGAGRNRARLRHAQVSSLGTWAMWPQAHTVVETSRAVYTGRKCVNAESRWASMDRTAGALEGCRTSKACRRAGIRAEAEDKKGGERGENRAQAMKPSGP